MSETSSQPGWVSVAEAARALEISETAVRKRIRAGTLTARGERGATRVQIPDVEGSELRSQSGAEPRSHPHQPELATNATLEVARLTGELAELRARFADAQADRDRWHANATAALERYNHDMQEMRALLGREQVIALSATSGSSAGEPDNATPDEDYQDASSERQRDGATAGDVEIPKPSADTLALGWRRWWRRITRG